MIPKKLDAPENYSKGMSEIPAKMILSHWYNKCPKYISCLAVEMAGSCNEAILCILEYLLFITWGFVPNWGRVRLKEILQRMTPFLTTFKAFILLE